MRKSTICGKSVAYFSFAALVWCLASAPAFAQVTGNAQHLEPNQTFGYGANEVVTFTYKQSFDCVDEPYADLNFNGIQAQSDPGEFQIPICQVGKQPNNDPTGLKGKNDPTEPLYVLVPMFSVDNDQNANDAIGCNGVVPGTNCGPALGQVLVQLFGALPEAFKAKPLVYTQCPDPHLPPGTCTMHASRLDLGPVLYKLGFINQPTNVFVPSPNHSHIVLNQDVNLPPIWWQVIPVLVLEQSDWPAEDGSSGITSVGKLEMAKKDGRVIEAPSNFFLFFSSQAMGHSHMH